MGTSCYVPSKLGVGGGVDSLRKNLLLKEQILFFKSILPRKDFVVQRSKQEVTEIVLLCKIAGKYEDVPFLVMISCTQNYVAAQSTTVHMP